MGELTITTFLTVDGVMQAPGGAGEDPSGGFPYEGWLAPYWDSDADEIVTEIFSKAEAFLLGRTTYDIFSAYWPNIADPDSSPLNTLPKYVASRTRSSFDWSGTNHVREVVAEIAEIKERYSGEVQVHGSGGLAQTLIQNNLIDEYRLWVFPLVLGTGKRLFAQGTVPAALTLVKSRTTSTGGIVSYYRRAGRVETGTFENE